MEGVFNPASFALSPKFPGLRFEGLEAFNAYLSEAAGTLDGRFEYEQSLATHEAEFCRHGTCAPCLRPARFTCKTQGGTPLNDGKIMPNWRESMLCDCPQPLNNRQRAILHFIQAQGILPWTRLLIFGAPSRVDTALSAKTAATALMRPFGTVPRGEGFHLAISHDYLQMVTKLDDALTGICDRLLAGGKFVFTVPFHHGVQESHLAARTRAAELFDETHHLGWDLLDRLRLAGFRDAAAYLYWSEELGYLGPRNFIFRAVK